MTKKNEMGMNEKSREILKAALECGTVVVRFLKNNGEERVMVCTKNLEQIPTDSWPNKESNKAHNDEACPVFDFEIGAWRSFRYDRVITFE